MLTRPSADFSTIAGGVNEPMDKFQSADLMWNRLVLLIRFSGNYVMLPLDNLKYV